MTDRSKGVALVISVILNVVLVCAIAAGLYMARQAWRDRPGRHGPPLFETARTLPRADQDRLRDQMRAAARASRPEFQQAREFRRKAAKLAAASTYDRAAVVAALRAANAAEFRGRDKLDERLASVLADLGPEARATLASQLEHRPHGPHGRRGRHGERQGDHAPADPARPPAAPPAAPAS